MDYEIKPTSRKELRLLARLFRAICGFSMTEAIDPVALLDRMPDLEGFDDVRYEVVEDIWLPGSVAARCTHLPDGSYVIQIKESVYTGAYERGVGGYRMHIIHEIMHVFLDKLGFQPIYSREFIGKLPPYRSLEWAVMAISGEVMMPYEITAGMSETELCEIYGVSPSAARKRLTY